ncbi:hypothetical protein [Sedimenticola selenatireducens]|uniref:Uncharacterized protein n=1 Tax=Sedimenticola selenatireducens TaxID=191960 RepID=A0A558DUM2_9GAMM|nr:hypothetical protein [Sedimenticola selenatireducens]TVO72492.1 hypothetical protein FHP88_12930 [Sedimenticola selenatireducens]TVT64747.1 MAG: hypothetical protein FHK78_06695 [Sedimenticola selenatireducens]
MAKQLQAFILLGLVSGLICGFGGPLLPDIEWLTNIYPGVVLGLFLFFAGWYVANRNAQKMLPALLVIVSASIIGWRLALKVGGDSGLDDLYLFAVCGAVGAGSVALGLLYAWRIRSGVLLFVLVTMFAGALGGFVFHMIELLTDISSVRSGDVWTIVLFTVWQTLLFVGLSTALRFSSARA